MNMKHLMMNGKVWIGAFTIIAVLVIVFAIIIPRMSENKFLESDGTATAAAAKQKLMVINQDTGAISFVNKSLKGINDSFVTEDLVVKNALKLLLGTNLKGDTDGMVFNGLLASGDAKYATKAELATLTTTLSAVDSAALDAKYATKAEIIELQIAAQTGDYTAPSGGWQAPTDGSYENSPYDMCDPIFHDCG